jgi:DNA-binding PadR family transcriptional regulator
MDIRTLCLGILTWGDASGYEIKKIFEDRLSYFYEASYGSIYPALTKLTDDGLVTWSAEAQDKRPDKKVYAISSTGRMAFMDALTKMPARDRIRSEFLAVMMYADLLPPRHLSNVIDDRARQYRAMIEDLQDCAQEDGSPSRQFVVGYGLALYGAALNYLENNRHLVEGEALLAKAAAERAAE